MLSQSVKAKEHLLEQSQSVEQSASKRTPSPKRHKVIVSDSSFLSGPSITAVLVAGNLKGKNIRVLHSSTGASGCIWISV